MTITALSALLFLFGLPAPRAAAQDFGECDRVIDETRNTTPMDPDLRAKKGCQSYCGQRGSSCWFYTFMEGKHRCACEDQHEICSNGFHLQVQYYTPAAWRCYCIGGRHQVNSNPVYVQYDGHAECAPGDNDPGLWGYLVPVDKEAYKPRRGERRQEPASGTMKGRPFAEVMQEEGAACEKLGGRITTRSTRCKGTVVSCKGDDKVLYEKWQDADRSWVKVSGKIQCDDW